jgi:hypothetical protein
VAFGNPSTAERGVGGFSIRRTILRRRHLEDGGMSLTTIALGRSEELATHLRGRFQGQHARADWMRLISGYPHGVHVCPVPVLALSPRVVKTHAHEQQAILMGDEVARWLPTSCKSAGDSMECPNITTLSIDKSKRG